ncbi:MAG: 2-isopropylmalate synthase [Pseudomonadota bacterium]
MTSQTTSPDGPADRHVRIFDTTLRDGEQAPGFSMDVDQKLRMARGLARLGVDIVEAGFPAASPGDFEAVRRIASEVEGPVMCGLARANPRDIERTAEAIAPAARRRIHTFIATSPIHREHKLRMDQAEVLKRIKHSVELAAGLADEVEFSAEDALRTERDFLAEAVAIAIEAGARTINLPDTVGYSTPEEIFDVFSTVIAGAPRRDEVVFSAHCHDDLGLAVANSLAAVRAGARQVECTINGIGERAGNCALEEIVMALRTRPDLFDGADTMLKSEEIYPTSRILESVTGQFTPRNKAVVGANAFAHESGIHQDGVLKNARTYEIIRPETVGAPTGTIVLGKHSGRAALADRAMAMGHQLAGERLDEVFGAFKDLADRKMVVTDDDLKSIILDEEMAVEGPWSLATLQASATGEDDIATATIVLSHQDGRRQTEIATGNGPMHAAFGAIKKATGVDMRLVDFSIRSIGAGSDAQGWADVRLQAGERSVHGMGVDTDILMAGAKAYLDALNRTIRSGGLDASDKPVRATDAA